MLSSFWLMPAHWTGGEIKLSRRGGKKPSNQKRTLCSKFNWYGHHAKIMVSDRWQGGGWEEQKQEPFSKGLGGLGQDWYKLWSKGNQFLMLHHSPKIPPTSPIIKQEQGNEAEIRRHHPFITDITSVTDAHKRDIQGKIKG